MLHCISEDRNDLHGKDHGSSLNQYLHCTDKYGEVAPVREGFYVSDCLLSQRQLPRTHTQQVKLRRQEYTHNT